MGSELASCSNCSSYSEVNVFSFNCLFVGNSSNKDKPVGVAAASSFVPRDLERRWVSATVTLARWISCLGGSRYGRPRAQSSA